MNPTTNTKSTVSKIDSAILKNFGFDKIRNFSKKRNITFLRLIFIDLFNRILRQKTKIVLVVLFSFVFVSLGFAQVGSPIGFQVSLTPSTLFPHPGSVLNLSRCYDEFNLNFNFSNLNVPKAPAPNTEITFSFPQLANVNFIITPTPVVTISPAVAGVSGVFSSNSNQAIISFRNTSTSSANISGSFTIVFTFNDCVTNPLGDFQIVANLSVNSSQPLNIETVGTQAVFLDPNPVPTNSQNMRINFVQPSIVFEKLSGLIINSKDEENFTRYDQVERFYQITPTHGITDYFTLDITAEDDADILKIEACDPTTGSPLSVIFDASGTSDPILAGSTYKIIFYRPSSTFPLPLRAPNRPFSSLPNSAPSSIYSDGNIIDVPISSCLPSSIPTYDCLWHDITPSSPAIFNKILIKETVRITKVENCEEPIAKKETSYTLNSYCDRQYTNPIPCNTFAEHLNVKSNIFWGDAQVYPGIWDGGLNDYVHYTSANDEVLNVCPNTSNTGFNLTFIINNAASLPAGSTLPINSGILELHKITIPISTQYFTVGTTFLYGTQPIIPTRNSAGDYVFDLDDPLNVITTNPNPNPAGYVGVVDRLNSFYPTGVRKFNYLLPGKKIGITFVGLKLADCSTLDVRSCGNSHISLSGYFGLDIKYMCGMGAAVNPITIGEFSSVLTSRFNGSANSSASNLDVGALDPLHPQVITGSTLGFSFNQSSTGIDAIHPWQISTGGTDVEIVNCPNKQYYAVLTLPNVHLSNLNNVYTPTINSIINLTNHTAVSSFTLTQSLLNPDQWIIEWADFTPNVSITLDMAVVCDNTSGFDLFHLDFRESCDINCADCYITFACTEKELHRHCFGRCPPSLPVGTTNFSMRRQTFGWKDYPSWVANPSNVPTSPPIPNTLPLGISYNIKSVYPCDKVQIKSTNGSVSPNLALTRLSFDVNFDKTRIALGLQNLVDFIPNTIGTPPNSYFKFTSIVNPACSLIVPVTSVSYPNNSLQYVIRIEADLNSAIPSTLTCLSSYAKVIDWLKFEAVTVDVQADFNIVDITSLPGGKYEIPKIEGQFTADAGGAFTSCDSYEDEITYLKLETKISQDVVGADSWTNYSYDQCDIVYNYSINVTGGNIGIDDFPGEFRPVLVFPKQIDFNLSNSKFVSSTFTMGNCTTPFLQNSPGILSPSSTSCVEFALDKNSASSGTFVMVAEKNCAVTNSIIKPINFPNSTSFPVLANQYNPGCLSTVEQPNPQNLSPSSANTFIINANFTPPSMQSVKNPTERIKVSLSCSNGWISGLANAFVYFDKKNLTDPNFNINLFDAAGVPIIPIVNINSAKIIFPIDNLTSTSEDYYMEVKWLSCLSDPVNAGAYLPETIKVNVSNICSQVSPDFSTADVLTCAKSTFDYIVSPNPSLIAIKSLTPINSPITTCQQGAIDFLISSNGSVLDQAISTVNIPDNIDIDFTNSTLGTKTFADINILSPAAITLTTTSPFILSINLISGIVQNGGQPNDFYLNSTYQDIPIHLAFIPRAPYPPSGTLRFVINALANSSCGTIISQSGFNIDVIYTPPSPITVSNVPSSICIGNSPVTLTANYTGSLSTPINWPPSQPNSSSVTGHPEQITASSPGGSYYVTATDQYGCSLITTVVIPQVSSFGLIQGPVLVNCGAIVPLSFVLQNPKSVTYLWSTGETTSTINPLVNTTTTFTVLVTDINTRCNATFTHTVTFSSTTCCGNYPNTLTQTDFNTTIVKSGNFNLNSNIIIPNGVHVTLQNGDIRIGAGVIITVANSGSLTLVNETLQGCGTMWNGIVMNDVSAVEVLSGSYILDANNGIEVVGNKTQLTADNSTFQNCVRGIFYSQVGLNVYSKVGFKINNCIFKSTASGFAADYPGQVQHGNIPYCGIELRSVMGNIGDYDYLNNKNYFNNLYRGVVTQNAIVTIKSALFENIHDDAFYSNTAGWNKNYGSCAILGSGLGANQITNNLTLDGDGNHQIIINNANRGVRTFSSNLKAYKVLIDNVDIGFTVQNCKNLLFTSIEKCNITARSRGILFWINDGASSITAFDNVIHMAASRSSIGIYVNEFQNGNGNYLIKENTITLNDAFVGIYINGMQTGTVEKNYITQTTSGRFVNSIGLSIDNSAKVNLKCNKVVNLIGNYTNTIGLKSNKSNDNQIECNTFDNNGTGIKFEDANTSTFLSSNEMKRNILGLELNSKAVIGPQLQNGNIWETNSSQIWAVNSNPNPNQILLSRFIVHTNMATPTSAIPEYFPPLNNSNFNNQWFFQRPGTPNDCIDDLTGNSKCITTVANTNNSSSASVSATNDNSYERLIAMDSLSSDVYNDETRSQARLYLYRRLLEDNDLLLSDVIFTTFMNQYESSAVGDLSEISAEIADLNVYSPSVTQILYNIDLEVQSLILNLDQISQQNVGVNVLDADSIRLRLIQLDLSRNMILTGINGERDASLDFAAKLNNTVTNTTELPEQNAQRVNEFYIEYEQIGMDAIENNFTELLNIAHLCPSQGGDAVFQARGLIEILNDSVVYDDESVCLLAGIYRLGSQSENKIKYILQPNPANNQVQISMILTDDKIKTIRVEDLMGKVIFQKTYEEKLRSQIMNTINFATGIYLITIEPEVGTSKTEKLIINH